MTTSQLLDRFMEKSKLSNPQAAKLFDMPESTFAKVRYGVVKCSRNQAIKLSSAKDGQGRPVLRSKSHPNGYQRHELDEV